MPPAARRGPVPSEPGTVAQTVPAFAERPPDQSSFAVPVSQRAAFFDVVAIVRRPAPASVPESVARRFSYCL